VTEADRPRHEGAVVAGETPLPQPAPWTGGWSLAMIVKDAQDTLPLVLGDAVTFCDELVVVDTGSSDATVEVARQHGATVHHFAWIDDFAAARNVAFDHCHGEWIVWLDDDDRVPPQAQAGFSALKRELAGRTDVDGAMVPYRTTFLENQPEVCVFGFDRERVIRRDAHLRWGGVVHEVIGLPPQRCVWWPAAWVEHRPPRRDDPGHPDRNLRILEKAVGQGDRSSRTLFYYANELRDHERIEEALGIYLEYMALGAADWERYAALLSMADCAAALDDGEQKLSYLHQAVALDSRRAEAFNRIGMHHYDLRQWERAIPFFTAASTLPRPRDGFVNDAHYTWIPWDYLSICCSELGRYQEALEHTVRALPTSTDRPRLMANVNFYLDRLAQSPPQPSA